MQPALATVAFAHYGEQQTPFSSDRSLLKHAAELARSFREILGTTAAEVVFVARIGEPNPRLPAHRSTRRALSELLD